MLKRKKSDSRLADLKSTTSNKAPDMGQVAEAPSPKPKTKTKRTKTGTRSKSRPAAPSTSSSAAAPTPQPAPAPRKRAAAPPTERPAPATQPVVQKPQEGDELVTRLDWKPMVLVILSVALLGYLLASGLSKISSTLQANQGRQTISDVWRQLLVSDVKIDGHPTALDEMGNASFPSVSMENISDKLTLHRNLRLAAALPGVKSLNLSPVNKRDIGAGVCDDSTLALAVQNFPVLDSLDLSATKVTSLTALNDLEVRELRLINTTIKHEKLPALAQFSSVTDIWVGWDFDSRNANNSIFRSPEYKAQLLNSLSKMKNLKNVYLYEMRFDNDERKKLPGVNIETL